jgi:hypothetical protein
VHLGSFDEARNVFNLVLKNFAGTPRAVSYANNNMGWLVDKERARRTRASLELSLSFYRAAKQAERRTTVYLNIVQFLLELDRVKEAEAEFAEFAEWLISNSDAIAKLRERIEIEGARFVKAISKSRVLSALVFRRGGDRDA